MGASRYLSYLPSSYSLLQNKDTAGQERFSSLSTAFFRGADAALLIFDVNDGRTMHAMKKWWGDFCDKAPVRDEELAEYCCVVVGNKIDLAEGSRVSESEALEFLDELVPRGTDEVVRVLPPRSESPPPQLSKPKSIALATQSVLKTPKQSRFYAGTMKTTVSIYHTPSSSVLDARSSIYQSARSSPEPWSHSEFDLLSSRQRMRSTGSTSSESGATITPSRFARERERSQSRARSNGVVLPSHSSPDLSLSLSPQSRAPSLAKHPFRSPPLPPERGPKLFFASAKTGEGVKDVFEYIAHRVVSKWDYEDWLEARRMHFRESTLSSGSEGSTRRPGGRGIIPLETTRLDRDKGAKTGWSSTCC